MKFLYRSFWTLSIMSWMLFLYILKNIQSTGFEIASILVGFFVVLSPLIAIFLAKHLSHDCISGCSEIECVDRKCVLVTCWFLWSPVLQIHKSCFGPILQHFLFCCINQKWCIFIQCWSFLAFIFTKSRRMRELGWESSNEEKLYEMQNTWFLITCTD